MQRRVKVLLAFGSIVASLLFAELLTRWFSFVEPPILIRDPLVGRKYLPGFEGKVYYPETGRRVFLRINDYGLRGPSWPAKRPPGTRRVAVLGDSMVAALSQDEEHTMVRVLEELLNETAGNVERWEVLNFGVSGSSTCQELILYRQLVRRFAPDFVLLGFFTGNDLADNSRRMTGNPRIYFDFNQEGELYQVPLSEGRAALSRWLNRNSRLYVWQKTALKKKKRVGGLAAGNWIFARQESADVDHAWRVTGEVIGLLADEVQQDGSAFAVVQIPNAAQTYRDIFEELLAAGGTAHDFDMDYPEERLAEMCRTTGIPFLSLVGAFREAAPDGTSADETAWLFHGGRGHLTQRGNELAARTLFEFLRTPPASTPSLLDAGSTR